MFNPLDHTTPNYVEQFDQLTAQMRSTNPKVIDDTQRLLSAFVQDDNSIAVVDKLLKHSSSNDTKFLAIQVLNDTISHRWNTIEVENQERIKALVMDHIGKLCVSRESVLQNQVLLTRYNLALVNIAKRDYPFKWPTFIQDISQYGDLQHPSVLNQLELLKVVGEEVLEFSNSNKTMTKRWRERKKEALKGDFTHIMNLTGNVLLYSSDPILLKSALELLTIYIPWLDPSYYMYENILEKIVNCIVGDPEVREAGLLCFTEICAVPVEATGSGDQHSMLIVRAFQYVFNNIIAALPTTHSSVADRVVALYEIGNSVDQNFIIRLSGLIIEFLKHYLKKMVYEEVLLVTVHEVLVGMSSITGDKELFKTCVEYWVWVGELMLRSPPGTMKQTLERRLAGVQSSVRFILMKRMAKPKEVIIVVEDGQVFRERVQDVEEVQMFELMQKTMIIYAGLNSTDTRRMLVKLLEKQLDGSEFSFENINSLTWAAGAIRGILPEDEEHEFFTVFLRGLLTLCKHLSGKQNRAVVASDILYFVGRYTGYLRKRSNFFRTVNKKVFEFMQESFEGVQEMAVDTLYKLSHDLAELYALPSDQNSLDGSNAPTNSRSLAEAIAEVWPDRLSLLNTPLKEVCFACAGCMVAKVVNAHFRDPNAQKNLLFSFLRKEHDAFKQLVGEATRVGGPDFLQNREWMESLLVSLKMFSSMASTCGDVFVAELELIVEELYGFYIMIGNAQQEVSRQPDHPLRYNHDYLRSMRHVKREILKLFENFIENSEQADFIATYCIPKLFEVILVDYHTGEASMKEPVVLALTAVCVDTLGARLNEKVAAVLDYTFASTVDLISQDFESYPEFRVNLFRLLRSLTMFCFPSFIEYIYSHEYIINGMLWSIKHVDYPTMSTALETLNNFLQRVNTMGSNTVPSGAGAYISQVAIDFYNIYMESILKEVFFVTLDSLHSAGFEYHCEILKKVFFVSSSMSFDYPVIGRLAISNYLYTLLREIPAIGDNILKDFIDRCFQLCSGDDAQAFNDNIADFLVETKVWGAEEEAKLLEVDMARAPNNSMVI